MQWMRTYGQGACTVDLGPGQVADVWYAAPFTQFNTGSMGATKQSPKGRWALAGMLAVVLLFCVAMIAATFATNNGTIKGSAMWLVGTYAVITVGELCLSPMGLSMVSKLSPPRLTALMMGG